MQTLDTVTLNFDPASLVLLNVILAAVMFGVALDLTPRDFTRLTKIPRALGVGQVHSPSTAGQQGSQKTESYTIDHDEFLSWTGAHYSHLWEEGKRRK